MKYAGMDNVKMMLIAIAAIKAGMDEAEKVYTEMIAERDHESAEIDNDLTGYEVQELREWDYTEHNKIANEARDLWKRRHDEVKKRYNPALDLLCAYISDFHEPTEFTEMIGLTESQYDWGALE